MTPNPDNLVTVVVGLLSHRKSLLRATQLPLGIENYSGSDAEDDKDALSVYSVASSSNSDPSSESDSETESATAKGRLRRKQKQRSKAREEVRTSKLKKKAKAEKKAAKIAKKKAKKQAKKGKKEATRAEKKAVKESAKTGSAVFESANATPSTLPIIATPGGSNTAGTSTEASSQDNQSANKTDDSKDTAEEEESARKRGKRLKGKYKKQIGNDRGGSNLKAYGIVLCAKRIKIVQALNSCIDVPQLMEPEILENEEMRRWFKHVYTTVLFRTYSKQRGKVSSVAKPDILSSSRRAVAGQTTAVAGLNYLQGT
ncbi:hypothetical protein VTL71DRAFT_7735 [Oculimacula yallundae]|uniref:Uncharacterized protein n=1 Tax=Oculimacula yallundae TaxID=86028 RepID=A0ABR4CVU1_9HELO